MNASTQCPYCESFETGYVHFIRGGERWICLDCDSEFDVIWPPESDSEAGSLERFRMDHASGDDWIPEHRYEDDQPSLREQLESEGIPQIVIAEIEFWVAFKTSVIRAMHKIRQLGQPPTDDIPF